MNLIDNLKLIGLNLREYISDIFLLVLAGLISNYIINLSSIPLHQFFISLLKFPQDYDFFPLSLEIIKIISWIIFFLFLRWALSILASFLSGLINNKYSFYSEIEENVLSEERFMKQWIFQGNCFLTEEGLIITNSNSGCLIRKRWYRIGRIWKNFTAEMEISFPSQNNNINPREDKHENVDNNHVCDDKCQRAFNKIMGLVFRAQNFDDYCMLEICYINNQLVIRPHIRVGGNWDAPILNPDHNSIPLSLTDNQSFRVEIVAKDNKVTVYINDDHENYLEWLIPTHIEPNLIQQAGDRKGTSKTSIRDLYFKDKAGMFGFRNYGNELVLVKSLNIH